MGSLTQGMQNRMVNARADKQQQMTMLKENMELGADGNMQYNEIGQTQQDMRMKQLEANQKAMEATLASTKAQTNADAMTGVLDNWINGDTHNAMQNFNKVKADLSKRAKLDVTDIEPLNFGDVRDTRELGRLGVDTSNMTPDLQDSLSRSFMKVTGHDGQKRIVPVDGVVKATNTWNMFNTEQRDRYTKNARNINAVMKGAGLTSTEEEAQELGKEHQMKYQKDMAAAVASGDMAEVQRVHNLYNPQTPKQATAADAAAMYKLSNEMKATNKGQYLVNSSGEFTKHLKSAKTGDEMVNVNGEQYSVNDLAKTAQGTNKIGQTQVQLLDGMISTVENTNRLRTKLANSDFDWNAISKVVEEVQKVTPEEWKTMTPAQRKKMEDKFAFNSDLQTVMAGYIKAMSGAAVSDEERSFYVGAILNGNWATKSSALAAMGGFIDGVYNGTKSQVDLLQRATPYDYLFYKRKLGTIDTKSPKAKNTSTTASATPSMPKAGDILDGYKFLGGNPADKASWEKQ